KHIYARENGWAIAALASLYGVTGEENTLRQAVRAAGWITRHRRLPGGGFRHGAQDVGGPFLGDSIAMTRAFLVLYGVTGDRQWLQEAEFTIQFIGRTFGGPFRGPQKGIGFITAAAWTDRAYRPHPQRDENIAVARASNLLFHYTGNAQYKQISESAMR